MILNLIFLIHLSIPTVSGKIFSGKSFSDEKLYVFSANIIFVSDLRQELCRFNISHRGLKTRCEDYEINIPVNSLNYYDTYPYIRINISINGSQHSLGRIFLGNKTVYLEALTYRNETMRPYCLCEGVLTVNYFLVGIGFLSILVFCNVFALCYIPLMKYKVRKIEQKIGKQGTMGRNLRKLNKLEKSFQVLSLCFIIISMILLKIKIDDFNIKLLNEGGLTSLTKSDNQIIDDSCSNYQMIEYTDLENQIYFIPNEVNLFLNQYWVCYLISSIINSISVVILIFYKHYDHFLVGVQCLCRHTIYMLMLLLYISVGKSDLNCGYNCSIQCHKNSNFFEWIDFLIPLEFIPSFVLNVVFELINFMTTIL